MASAGNGRLPRLDRLADTPNPLRCRWGRVRRAGPCDFPLAQDLLLMGIFLSSEMALRPIVHSPGEPLRPPFDLQFASKSDMLPSAPNASDVGDASERKPRRLGHLGVGGDRHVRRRVA